MGLKGATIYLDNQYNTYYTGQTIVGRIEYVFDTPKRVQGVTVQFKGLAHTEFYERRDEQNADSGKMESREMIHYGDEEYFNVTQYLLGDQRGEQIDIPAGTQVYNFSYTLPTSVPSSFEGKHGHIRYTIKLSLVRPWKFNQETKMAFTVINVLDLNLNPNYKKPFQFQFEKSFCCLCCKSAPLSVDIRAPVSGYCAGQVIPFQVDIENKSNVDIQLVKIIFRRVVMYKANTPVSAHKKVEDDLQTLQEGPAPAGSSKNWILSLQIPSIPPSNLVNCNIMDLDYDIKVECVVSGAHMNLRDKKYIAIGTVPLVGVPSAPAPSPTQPAVLPVNPTAPSASGDAGWVAPGTSPGQPPFQNLYPALVMPEYKESQDSAATIHDGGDTEFTKIVGPTNFAPFYPTYASVQPPPLPQ